MMRKLPKFKYADSFFKDVYFWMIIAIVVSITALHYFTPTHYHHLHEIYRRIYYLPIIIGAFRYDFYGGLITSLVVGLIYVPHVIFQWQGSIGDNLVRFMEIGLYLVVGCVSGLLSRRVRLEKDRYKEVAEKLSESYSKMEDQTRQLSEMEMQLRTADRLAVLGELSASLAHEVRNPLGSIKGAVDIISKRCSKDHTIQEFSSILRKEVTRLNTVVDNYLKIAHRSSGNTKRSALTEIIPSVVSLLGPEIAKRQVGVKIELPDSIFPVALTDVEAQQVFINLLLNALAAMDNGGSIIISGRSEGNKILVSIRDDGKGIPEKQLEKIFQPFYTSRRNGTGLGLAIVKRIMESAHGTIHVDSQVGVGSVLTLTFVKAERD